jgi:dihydrofolate synthase/folylpolyglutamate synthase
MGFLDAQAHLDALGIDAMKSLTPSLHRIEAMCAALGHPERTVPAIHVTGTNGKTSTARIMSSVLTATGLAVGTYTSPHLETVRERITRSGEAISEEEFGELFDHIVPFVDLVEKELEERLSYFETLTGMFYLWAAEAPVDVMVVEVGLGGRWDATNVVPAEVAVVTNIGFDHTDLLGTDRETIAHEKAGIIKPGARAITAERRPSVLAVLEEQCAAVGAKLSRIGRDFSLTDNRTALGGRYLSMQTTAREYSGQFLPLHGAHQGVNALTALEAVVQFLPEASLDAEVVADGLAAAAVPGRLEVLKSDAEVGPPLVLDVAHNPDGMSVLVTSLLEAFAFERIVFVVGILGDKDYGGMLTELTRLPCHVVATEAKTVRSVPPREIRRRAEELGLTCEVEDEVEQAIRRAARIAGASDLVCITGSHYVVGEARSFLLAKV